MCMCVCACVCVLQGKISSVDVRSQLLKAKVHPHSPRLSCYCCWCCCCFCCCFCCCCCCCSSSCSRSCCSFSSVPSTPSTACVLAHCSKSSARWRSFAPRARPPTTAHVPPRTACAPQPLPVTGRVRATAYRALARCVDEGRGMERKCVCACVCACNSGCLAGCLCEKHAHMATSRCLSLSLLFSPMCHDRTRTAIVLCRRHP